MSDRWPSRPTLAAAFYKAHGLGNDYLVFEEGGEWAATEYAVQLVCDRYRGPGADGIVALVGSRHEGPFELRMFNPDGSEFERSGNGLRVLASYLARSGRVRAEPFTVRVGGSELTMRVHAIDAGGHDVSVEMGRARPGAEPVALTAQLDGSTWRCAGPDGEALEVVPVSIGNPHLVVVGAPLTDESLERLGPHLSAHSSLAHGANVQLAAPEPGGGMRALIWERGVGRTSASGTSACAVAVAGVLRGHVPPGQIRVEMDGGTLQVDVTDELDVTLRGPVEEVYEGRLAAGLLAAVRADG